MHTVKVDRIELLKVLRNNMIKHVEEYNKAVKQFRLDVIDEMKRNLNQAENGGYLYLSLREHRQPPTSYESEYKRAIAMLSASIDDVIVLDSQQFNQYWLDEWTWKGSISNTAYASKLL
jgi:hypothetical protein